MSQISRVVPLDLSWASFSLRNCDIVGGVEQPCPLPLSSVTGNRPIRTGRAHLWDWLSVLSLARSAFSGFALGPQLLDFGFEIFVGHVVYLTTFPGREPLA